MKYKKIIEFKTLEYFEKHSCIQKALKYILSLNKSQHAPYHNIIHIMNVCHSVVDITTNSLGSVGLLVEQILIAALFHDVGHSEGSQTDDKNVSVALEHFHAYISLNRGDLPPSAILNIIGMIENTKYPYDKTAEDLTYMQNVLRDSDVSQIMSLDTYFAHNIVGLKNEYGKDLSWEVLLKNQRSFIESLHFGTSYMEAKWNGKKDEVLKYQTELEKIFNKL
jgi:hypothetical protein